MVEYVETWSWGRVFRRQQRIAFATKRRVVIIQASEEETSTVFEEFADPPRGARRLHGETWSVVADNRLLHLHRRKFPQARRAR